MILCSLETLSVAQLFPLALDIDRRFSEEVTSHICPNKIYYTTLSAGGYTTKITLPYSYFSNCLKSQCCVEAEAAE